MHHFLVLYVLDDGTRSYLTAIADSSCAALETVQRLFGVRLRYAAARPTH